MRTSLKDIKIGKKIAILVGVSLLLMGLVIGLGLVQIKTVGDQLKAIVEEQIPLTDILRKIAVCQLEQAAHLERAIRYGKLTAQDKTTKDKFKAEREEFVKHGRVGNERIEKGKEIIERAYGNYITVERGERILRVDYELRGIHKEFVDYQFLAARVFNLISQNKVEDTNASIQEIENKQGELEKARKRLLFEIENFIRDLNLQAEKSEQTAIIGMLSISILLLLLSLTLGISISRSITRPLLEAVKIANQIAEGERSLKIQVTTKDEMGLLLTTLKNMSVDLSEAEQTVKEERNLLRTVIDNVPDHIYVKDTENRYVVSNNAFARRVGATTQEVIGKTVFELFTQELASQFYADDQEIIRSGQLLLNRESSYADKTGKKIWNQTSKVPLRDSSGKIVGLVGIARDITERKRTEEALKKSHDELQQALSELKKTQAQILQSEKMASIGQLAAGVAHEINNPTGFVSSNLKTLSDYQNDIFSLIKEYKKLIADLKETMATAEYPGSIPEQMEQIVALESKVDINYILDDIPNLIEESQEGTERIKKIVIDLKDFAHPGEQELKYANINKNLDSTLNIVWNELKYKATVTKDYGDLPQVQCYPQQISQVFMNLLINAAQAIEKQGEIRIATRAVDGQVEVAISDTGSGIPKENLSKIFDPFFTTREVGKGTGLGLNVAYNIVKKHKGTIDVDSQVRKGTTFIIRIPVETDA
jgi:PAS domain S-box-containing protein